MFNTLLAFSIPFLAILWVFWCFICTAAVGILTMIIFGIALSCGFDAVRSDFYQSCGVVLMYVVGIGFGTWSFLVALTALKIFSKKSK